MLSIKPSRKIMFWSETSQFWHTPLNLEKKHQGGPMFKTKPLKLDPPTHFEKCIL